jgi:hypothetical protein
MKGGQRRQQQLKLLGFQQKPPCEFNALQIFIKRSAGKCGQGLWCD